MASILKVNTIQDATNSNTALSIDSDGTTLPQKVPACLIYRANAYSGDMTLNSYTKVPYDTASINTHSMADVSNNRINFTTATAGLYYCWGQIGGNLGNTLIRYNVALRKNGSTYIANTEISDNQNGTNKYPLVGAGTIHSFVDGDNLDCAYYIQSGSGVSYGSYSVGLHYLYCYRISA